MKTIRTLIPVLALIGAAALRADDKPTRLADARIAVEANLKTPEGKVYDEKLGKEFMEKHLSTMKQCKQTAGSDLESFWILMKLDKDGAVKEVLLHPATKLGACSRETLLKSAFSPPPKPAYWGQRLHENNSLSLARSSRRVEAARKMSAARRLECCRPGL